MMRKQDRIDIVSSRLLDAAAVTQAMSHMNLKTNTNTGLGWCLYGEGFFVGKGNCCWDGTLKPLVFTGLLGV